MSYPVSPGEEVSRCRRARAQIVLYGSSLVDSGTGSCTLGSFVHITGGALPNTNFVGDIPKGLLERRNPSAELPRRLAEVPLVRSDVQSYTSVPLLPPFAI